MPTGSPLLDQYDKDGIVTPGLQNALDMVRQRMGTQFNLGSMGGGGAPPSAASTPGLVGPAPSIAQPQPAPVPLTAISPAPRPLGLSASPEYQHLAENQRSLTDPTLASSKPGIERIHNPWLRTPLQVLQGIGETFAPRITAAIPGTEAHHQGLIARNEARMGNLEKRATEEAGREHFGAETENLQSEVKAREHPKSPPDKFGTPIETAEGYVVPNETTSEAKPLTVGGQPVHKVPKPTSPKIIKDAGGNLYHDMGPNHAPEPVMVDGQHLKAPIAAPKPANKDDQYMGILEKIAKGEPLSKDEAAQKTAFEGWVKAKTTDPRVAGYAALAAGRPVQVVGEGNTVHWDIAGHAIQTGAETPGSIPFQAAKGTTTSFTSGANATTLNAINTAHAHITQLGQIADALKNGNIPILNRIANEFAQQTGQPAPASFQLLKTAVASEIGKTTRGGIATDAETKEINAAINAANSPAQLSGVLDNARKLMESKREQLRGQFEQGVKGKPNFEGGAGGGQSLPGGISIDDINAEIERRKKAKGGK